MADELITERELALWTQTPEATIAADPFAAEVREKVSDFVRFVAGQTRETWTATSVPYDARVIVLWIAKRTYQNPGQVVQEGVGPLNERRLDEAALGMSLTESERDTLEGYRPGGDPDKGIYVISTGGTPGTLHHAVLFAPDGSYSDWYIPMFREGDPGDPNLYDTEV